MEPSVPTSKGKVAWFVRPATEDDRWYYGFPDSVCWSYNWASKTTRVYVEYQKDSSPFLPWFDARADSLRRVIVIPFEPGHQYRLRIRGNTGAEWDSSLSFNVREVYRITFPGRNLVLTRGMRVKLRHTAYGNPPMPLELQKDPARWEWLRLAGASSEPEFIVKDEYLALPKVCLRLRDSVRSKEYTSDVLLIRDYVNPEFGISTRFAGARFVSGQEVPVSSQSTHGPVAFDFSTDAGGSWTEVIPPNAAPLWHVRIDRLSTACRMRMRATDPDFPVMIETGEFEVDTALVLFRITWPSGGTVLKAGDYIHPTFLSAVGDSVTFSLSTDDGATWFAWHQYPGDSAGQRTDFGMFIYAEPSTMCRMEMQSRSGGHTFISERFAIGDDLADFFPIDVGVEWIYGYSPYQYPLPIYTSWKIFRVQQKEVAPDTIRYTCLVSDSSDGRVTKTSTAVIWESRRGLHEIRAPYTPLHWVPARYFSRQLAEVFVDRYQSGKEVYEWFGKLENGVGFTRHYYTNYMGHLGRITARWELLR